MPRAQVSKSDIPWSNHIIGLYMGFQILNAIEIRTVTASGDGDQLGRGMTGLSSVMETVPTLIEYCLHRCTDL